ncbi:hypothetical protein UT300005_19650 [Clostridium sp. CTA-5]
MNLINYLDVEITSLWNDYAENRNIRLKKIANKKLNKLIEYLESKSKEVIKNSIVNRLLMDKRIKYRIFLALN